MYIYNKKGLYHYLHIAREPKVQHIFCSETIIYMILHFNIYANISILVFFHLCSLGYQIVKTNNNKSRLFSNTGLHKNTSMYSSK